jgi:hypothetical protein
MSGDMTATAKKGPSVANLLGSVGYIYMFVAILIFAPYYNWQYAKDNGFASWLLLGEIVPTAKAMIWPYYVFFNKTKTIEWTKTEEENLRHLTSSFHARAAAFDIMSSKNASTITAADVALVVNLDKTALSESQLVTDNVLDKIHPDFQRHFNDEYKTSIFLQSQFLDGTRSTDDVFNQANDLANKWADWYESHSKEFHFPQ